MEKLAQTSSSSRRSACGEPGCPADPVLPNAGAALLHAGRRVDDGRQPRPGAARLRLRRHEALIRRRALDHRRRLGGLRRRLGQRGRQRLGPRLGPDPLAEEPRLPGGPLRGQQRDLGGDRHPDPALDPDDPLRAGKRQQRRRPVRGRRPARPPDGGRLRVTCWWIANAAATTIDRQPADRRAPAAGDQVEPGDGAADPDPSACASASRRRPRWRSCRSSTRCC